MAGRLGSGPVSRPGAAAGDARIIIADVSSVLRGSPASAHSITEAGWQVGSRRAAHISWARTEAIAVCDDAGAVSGERVSALDDRWRLIDASDMESDGSLRPAELWITAYLWVEYTLCRRRNDLIVVSHSESLVPDLESILQLGVRASILGRRSELPPVVWEIESDYPGQFRVLNLGAGIESPEIPTALMNDRALSVGSPD